MGVSKSPEAPLPSVEAEDPEPWEGAGTSDANERVRRDCSIGDDGTNLDPPVGLESPS